MRNFNKELKVEYALLLLFVFTSINLSGANIYVNDASATGDVFGTSVFDGSGDGSLGDPYGTLASALSAASASDIIYVDAGTYTDDLINWPELNSIQVIGAGKTLTIFQQSGSGDRFLTIDGTASTTSITDLTIENYDESNSGGAVYITTSGSVTFQDVLFNNNSTTTSFDDGGAVYISSSSTVTFDRCTFTNNSSYNDQYAEGSVIYSEGTMTVQNCLFYDNTANYTSDNGTVFVDDGTSYFYNCTFTENSGAAAEVYFYAGSNHIVKNCLLYNNGSSNDLYEQYASATLPTVTYTFYESRSGGFNTGSETGNITSGVNPLFVSPDNNDFNIRYTSVCRNAGNATSAPSVDINGDTRSTHDMGAFEWDCSSATGGTVTAAGLVCNNATATMTVYGFEAQYFKWQSSTDNASWSDITSTDTNKYTTPALNVTTYYRSAASCDNSTWAYSTSIAQTVTNNTIYVNDNSATGDIFGTSVFDGSGDGSLGDPYGSLADAFSAATCGDTIKVDAGTYNDDLVNWAELNEIYIMGAGIGVTIYQQSGSGDRFMTVDGTASGSSLTDMTVENYDENSSGGAIYITTSGSIAFEDILFNNNSTTSSFDDGGCVYISSSSTATFNRCKFTNNSSFNDQYAEGSVVYSEGSMTFTNCLFYDNTANYTSDNGTVFVDDGLAEFINCTFTENSGANAEIYYYGNAATNGVVKNCLLFNNGSSQDILEDLVTGTYPTVSYTFYESRSGSFNTGSETGNITSGENPLFVSPDNDDFNIRYGSLCRNTGTDTGAPSVDINGDTRTTTDIGAYEWDCSAANGGTVTAAGLVCNNSTATMTTYGYEGQYFKWQNSTDNSSWSDISSTDTNKYTTPALNVTTYYRTAASCDNSTWAYSASIAQTVTNNIIYVNDNSATGDIFGTSVFDGSGDGSIGDPYGALSDAFSAATCGDTIKVEAGTYNDDLVNWAELNEIYIMGAGVGLTIFEQSGSGDRFMTIDGTATGSTIADMTIQNYDESSSGGAIYLTTSGTIAFIDVLINNNSTTSSFDDGGAIYISSSSTATFNRCTFTNNSSFNNQYAEGSVVYSEGSMTYTNCLFYDNTCNYTSGNGTVFVDDGLAEFVNCTFTENSGGASEIYYYGNAASNGIVKNCILYNNSSAQDILEDLVTGTYPTVSYTLYESRSGSFNTGSEAGNNTSDDPLFNNAAGNDFSIQSSSNAVDAGTATGAPSVDILGVSRPGTPDMGAYEYYVFNWTGATSTAWALAGNWSTGSIPTSNDSPTIPDVSGASGNFPDITTSVSLSSLTINSNASITISSNTLSVAGATDVDGTMSISNATVDLNGTADFTNGTIDFTHASGKLSLSSTVTSLGTLDNAMGTVEYDGGTQTIVADNYYSLEIDVAGTKTAAGNLDIDGDLTTSATATCQIDMSTYDINVAGNITIGATDGSDFAENDCMVTFDGGSNQTFTHAGNTGSELTNATINKGGGELDLSSVITVDGTLTLTAGHLDASTNAVTFENGGTTGSASLASHIKGTIIKNTTSTSSFTFPIGDGTTQFEPLTIVPNSTSANTWQLTYTVSDHGDRNMGTGMDHVSWSEYWDLSRTSGSNGVQIAFNWDSNDGVSDYSTLTVAHFTGGNWEVETATPVGSNTAGTITTDGYVTSFSPFTKGSTSAANVLPVNLLSLDASCEEDRTDISWVTASEVNNDYFLLERAGSNGLYEYVGEVTGSGTTTNLKEYNYSDYDHSKGLALYRMTQYDFDGGYESFKTVTANCKEDQPILNFDVVSSHNEGYVTIIADEIGENVFYDLRVIDITGKQIYVGQHYTENGEINDKINLENQPRGNYVVQVLYNNTHLSKKISW